jgi:hypothetical protein
LFRSSGRRTREGDRKIVNQRETKPGKISHGLRGNGVLAIWNDIDAENEAEFNNWYTHQHLPERVGIQGFLRGRRYVAPLSAENRNIAKYFTLYELESIQTLTSPAYMARLNSPTEWTKKIVPLFRNGNRRAYRVTGSIGAGIGGQAATIAFGPADNKEGKPRDWLHKDAMPEAFKSRPELTGIHLLEPDDVITRAKDQTEEGKSATMVAPSARWVVMVEGLFETEVEGACDELASVAQAHGMADIKVNRYQLIVSLSHQGRP